MDERLAQIIKRMEAYRALGIDGNPHKYLTYEQGIIYHTFHAHALRDMDYMMTLIGPRPSD